MLRYRWIGAVLGAGALLLRMIAAQFPEGTESVYSRTVFPVIRQLLDASISKFPFPSVYLFVLTMLIILLFNLIQLRKRVGIKSRFRYQIRFTANFFGFLTFFFLVLWGYNYQRIPLYRQLSLEPVPLKQEELQEEISLTHRALAELRLSLTSDTFAIEEGLPYLHLEERVRKEIKKSLPLLSFDSKGHPRTKEFFPAGFLRRVGILGIYFPFTGESYIDPTLHPLEKPFTVAHEMAHSFGITNEGEANFISWVTGINSDIVLLRYSAQLQLFRYQLNDLYKRDFEAYRQVIENVDPGIRNDITSIMLKAMEIQPISQELSRKSNDVFLKTQGVKAGVQSYAQLPMLAHAWRKRETTL